MGERFCLSLARNMFPFSFFIFVSFQIKEIMSLWGSFIVPDYQGKVELWVWSS